MSNVFNQSALSANRQGRLAPLQILTLAPYLFGGGFIFIIGAGLSYGALYTIYNLLVHHVMENGTIIGIIMFAGLGVWLLTIAWSATRNTVIDLVSGKVIYVDGPTRKHAEPKTNGRGNILYYSIGETAFQIPAQSTWNALPEAPHVRAYYTPKSATFVNVEVLASERK